MPHTPYHEMRDRVEQHSQGMRHALNEAHEHILAMQSIPAKETEPEERVKWIGAIIVMMQTAQYHAERIAEFERMMTVGFKVKE